MTLRAIILAVLIVFSAQSEPNAGPPVLVNSIGMRLALVPAGRFHMGSAPGETGRRLNEGPRHVVEVPRPFYLSTCETTVAEFRAFVEATGYLTEAERDVDGGFGIDFETARVEQGSSCTWRDPGFPGFEQRDDHPVVLISWRDAEAFCAWLSEREGRRYRLPTEAEWEYAARGGATTAYWWGDEPELLASGANVADESLRRAVPAAGWAERWSDGHPFTAPVGSFAPNPFGLHDVHGNVWEWCADAYRPYPTSAGAYESSFRAIRGGGWFNAGAQNRSAQRVYFEPTFRYCLLSGFRILLEAEPST